MNHLKKKIPEFDEYSKDYKKLLTNSFPKLFRQIEYYTEYKIKKIFNLRKNLKTKKILDFGCGIGMSFNFLFKYFPTAKIWGYDNSSFSIKQIKKKLSFRLNLTSNLNKIPKKYFDVIIVANVFHHIKHNEHKKTLNILKKLLNKNGAIYIFEHNKLNPITNIIFSNSYLDRYAKMVPLNNFYLNSKKCNMRITKKIYTLYFPKLLSFLNIFEKFINWIPLGAQYLIVLKK